MKKKVLISFAIVFVSASFLMTFWIVKMNRANSSREVDAVKTLTEKCTKWRNEVENPSEDSGNQEKILMKEGAELFEKISKGDIKHAKEYAQLLRTMTANQMEFKDNEVFSVAESLAEYFTKVAEGNKDFGIRQIKIIENSSKGKMLRIEYDKYIVDGSKYSIRKMEEEEKMQSGNRFIEDDGLFGKYKIEISFCDVKLCDSIMNKYPVEARDVLTVQPFEDVPADLKSKLNVRVSYIDDSLCIIYIGSDAPIYIEDQMMEKIDPSRGYIELAIEIK